MFQVMPCLSTGMYLELEFSYCFTPVDFLEYMDQIQWNHTETETSYRLRTIGDAHLRSLYIFTLLGCFHSLHLLSTPTYLHKWGLNNKEEFPTQKY